MANQDIPATPSVDRLNRKLGALRAPRMLTDHEIELLRKSAREIAAVTRYVREQSNGRRAMTDSLKRRGKTNLATPSVDLLNRKLGPSPFPRMLTEYEDELLRRAAHEISRVTTEVLRRGKRKDDGPAKPD